MFADIGKAFNDWEDPDLKRGIGIGIRWYSFAGEIRIDVAQAIDYIAGSIPDENQSNAFRRAAEAHFSSIDI